MRIIYCFCGYRVEGTTDTDLFQRYRDHQKHVHPTDQTPDAQTWVVIKANAYEDQHVQTRTESKTSEEQH